MAMAVALRVLSNMAVLLRKAALLAIRALLSKGTAESMRIRAMKP
jgi:hypothetical protein